MLRKPIFIILAAFGLLLLLECFSFSAPGGKLIIFHAGSLSVPFSHMERQFEAMYPGVDLQREAGGSTKMARLIRDVGKPADIIASADYKVIEDYLMPDLADWVVRFASNQMVLCYTDKSRYANEINSGNWFDILLKKEVLWGHADPNLDPCGYRSLMVMQLAERFYNRPGLFNKLMAARAKSCIRPKSVELISLLKTGNMDYAWEYLSVAVQHGLHFVRLDDRINLGNEKFDSFYRQARVRVMGKRPGTWAEKRGKACVYGVALLKRARNRETAIAFLRYLLSPDGGLKILKESGQPPIIPCRVGSRRMLDALPKSLKSLVSY